MDAEARCFRTFFSKKAPPYFTLLLFSSPGICEALLLVAPAKRKWKFTRGDAEHSGISGIGPAGIPDGKREGSRHDQFAPEFVLLKRRLFLRLRENPCLMVPFILLKSFNEENMFHCEKCQK